LSVGQLPVAPGQPWIGESLPSDGGIARLLVDSWSEVAPVPQITTGVTFNYDEPKAQPPQALLLAVPPDPARGWDFQSLEAALLETFELAKLRGIVAQELSDSDYPAGGLEFYRPALYMAGNQQPELEAATQGA
jgi:hypothetical protein